MEGADNEALREQSHSSMSDEISKLMDDSNLSEISFKDFIPLFRLLIVHLLLGNII